MKRNATAVWQGSGKEGKGNLTTQSTTLKPHFKTLESARLESYPSCYLTHRSSTAMTHCSFRAAMPQ